MVDYLRTFARGDVLIEAAVFGYIRVSQAEGASGLATQRRILTDHGLRDDRIFTDVASGRNMRRPAASLWVWFPFRRSVSLDLFG